jgi:membrane protease YdiL (CAAX protease family)
MALIAVCWVFGGAYAYALVLQLPLGIVAEFAAINASVLMLMVGVIAVTRMLHRRSWRTLVTPLPAVDWRRIVLGAMVWGALLLLGAAVESLLFPGRYAWTPDWRQWLPFVVAALLLTPLQCLAEELAFRGYLMQGLARLWRHPAFVAVASSVVFTLPHLDNPEAAAHGLWIMAANYFVMALFLATITLRDGRLELAIGAHTANNLLLALGVNYRDSVFDTPSLFTAAILDPVYSLLTLLLGAAAFHLCVFRKRPSMNNGFSAAEVAQFERDGYQIVRGLVPAPECARMLEVAARDLAAVALPVEYEVETQYPGAGIAGGARRQDGASPAAGLCPRCRLSRLVYRCAGGCALAPVARSAACVGASPPQLRDDQGLALQQPDQLASRHPLLVVCTAGTGVGVVCAGPGAAG